MLNTTDVGHWGGQCARTRVVGAQMVGLALAWRVVKDLSSRQARYKRERGQNQYFSVSTSDDMGVCPGTHPCQHWRSHETTPHKNKGHRLNLIKTIFIAFA
jgi:hypothetical protein